MARQETDRENLLRDATALVERIELAPVAEADVDSHVVIGFRSDGALSVYFGADPVYHFNSSGQLRRAYCGGLLFKAEHGKLVSLERVRQTGEVQLVRRPLLENEQSKFLVDMIDRLHDLMHKCACKALVAVGQVPADVDVLRHALDWLSQCERVTIAKSPHAR